MHLNVGTIYTFIEEIRPWELKNVSDALTFTVEGYRHSKQYRRGLWDGRKTFLWKKRGTGEYFFFTGLLHLLEGMSNCITITQPVFADLSKHVTPDLLKTVIMDGKWSYQERALREALKARRGIWWLATGAGKTFIAAAAIAATRFRTLFIVPRLELMKQTAEVFARELDEEISVGWLGGGEDVEGQVVVGIVNSLVNKHKKDSTYLDSFEMVFADECHLSSAETYVEVLTHCTSADYRFGLSGTPLELDIIRNVKLTGMFGPVITKVSNAELIELGVNAKPLITIHRVDKTSEETDKTDWASLYKANVTENYYRNKIVVDVVEESFRQDLTTLVLVHSIKHGNLLAEMMQERGVITTFCSGKSSKSLRFDRVDGLKEGRYKVLILSKIGEVGLDIPALDVVIRASGGKSTVSTLQALGRGLRAKQGRENIIRYHDFWDGLDKYTRMHSRRRVRDYEKEGFDIEYV